MSHTAHLPQARLLVRIALWTWCACLGMAAPVSAERASQAAPPGSLNLRFGEASGCGGLTLYTWNEERTEVLVLHVNQEQVALRDGATDFDLHPSNPAVVVRVEVTDMPRDDFPYCTDDTSTATRGLSIWTAIGGRVRVTVARRPKATFSLVSIQIDRLVLTGAGGAETRQRREIRFTAAIGDPIR